MIATDGEPTIASGSVWQDHTVTGPFVGDTIVYKSLNAAPVTLRVVSVKPDGNFSVHAVDDQGDHYYFTYEEIDRILRG